LATAQRWAWSAVSRSGGCNGSAWRCWRSSGCAGSTAQQNWRHCPGCMVRRGWAPALPGSTSQCIPMVACPLRWLRWPCWCWLRHWRCITPWAAGSW